MRGLRLLLVFGLLIASGSAAAGSAQINGVRLAQGSDRTRVALDLSRPAQHRLFTLSNPDRVVIDIDRGRISGAALPLPSGTGAVRKIRSANRKNGSVRVVLDLAGPVRAKSFALAPNGKSSDRLVIDLYPGGNAPVRTTPVKRAEEAIANPGRDLVIAIDPGHGGKDPGAHGPGGTREKDVVLRISRRLADVINGEPGMRAVLTRNRDDFIHLRDRLELARSVQADLFISIHADAFRDRRVRGATVYVLSKKGATDEAAKRLAERENKAALIGGVKLDNKDETLASVLLDLSQNAAIGASFAIGEEILDEIGGLTKLRKRHVQQAPFLVLKSPDVPSVLIETAYISNPSDERNLGSRRYRNNLARAIFGGIRDYFYANPPPGTRVAELSRNGYRGRLAHVIRRGDTLSELADRYKVSVRRIRAENNLKGDRIRVGQVLRIPPTHDI